jgi:transposase
VGNAVVRRQPMKVQERDSLETLREAVQRASDADERDRIRMVMHARQGETGASIAQRLGYTDRAVRKWVQRYNEGGLAGLKDLPRSGRPRHLDAAKDEEVRQRLDAGAQPGDGVCALRGEDVRRILEDEFGARYTLSGTYAVLHRLGYSSLVPRPQHPDADPAAQEEFEKNSEGDGAEHRPHASRRRDPDLGAG